MNHKRREICRTVGVGLGTGALAASASGAAAAGGGSGGESAAAREVGAVATGADLRIKSVTLPDEIVLGEPFSAGAVVENAGDAAVTTEVNYTFRNRIIAGVEKEFEPGSEVMARLPNMKSEWLERDADLDPGTYTHGIGIEAGPRESASVKVTESSGTATETATGGNLAIDSVRLPDVIRPGSSYSPSVRIRNTGDDPVSAKGSYKFDGQMVMETMSETIQPGRTESFSFPEVTLDMIETSVGSVEAGEHTHSMGKTGGPRASETVVVGADATASSDQSSGTTDYETGGSDGTDSESAGLSAEGSRSERPERRTRGFFSNDGDAPAFLGDVFNLTFAGFLLSVAGIVHQMLKG
ncbi:MULTISPECIES: hypothetical protein [Halorussus]|uniref:hypothetical protein n=1 Tax=Halorussus TaxID=1070314 RepID=UPI000E21388C|nr:MULTISPECIES: hypothetical protein [Halorussus]NHN60009.1 hypothetical protein [Halorussus sp. JP-T4]